ncbi:conserved hypothetical protein [Bacillus sp. IT-79MI2]
MELKVSQPFIISQIWSATLLFLDLPQSSFSDRRLFYYNSVSS